MDDKGYTVGFVPKGWGFEKHITNNDKYCGKLLYFVKGRGCSFHYHNVKDEVFYIHKGRIYLYTSDGDDFSKAEVVILNQGDTYHITPGLRHKMLAIEDTELFEFSTHDEPGDSIRVVRGD